MQLTFRKTFLVTAAITMWSAMFPSVLPAQTSGVGCDGYTRFLWRGTDSRISLWKLDGGLNGAGSVQYGPYDGWVPVAMTVLCNNYTYVLWKHTEGSISLWKVDPNLNLVTSRQYGPYTGWIPESLSPDQAYPGYFRLLWRETQGSISIWGVDSNLVLQFSKQYGPYFGFDPSIGAATTGGLNVGGASLVGSSAADPGVEAMRVTSPSTPMPVQ